MDTSKLRRICMSLPGATENIQWGNDRVFKIAGKMFACSGLEPDSRYSFKCDKERFLELTDQPGIVPAPYLARASWVQIDPANCCLPDDDLKALVCRSHALVLSGLSKKLQREIVDAEPGSGDSAAGAGSDTD